MAALCSNAACLPACHLFMATPGSDAECRPACLPACHLSVAALGSNAACMLSMHEGCRALTLM
eukprot:365895-Chlamydomonas_euryale.AAC.8